MSKEVDYPMLAMPIRLSKKFFISYIVGAILLYFFLRNSDWSAIWTGMRSVSWPLLGAAVAFRLAALLAASLRWQSLLLSIRAVRFTPVATTMMIGMAVNTAVSMQAAEFVRPYVLSKQEGLDFSSVLSTVVVEWFLDLIAILALFVPSLILFRASGGHPSLTTAGLNQAVGLLLAGAIGGLVILRIIHRHAKSFGRILEHRHFLLPSRLRAILASQVEHFAVGLDVLRHLKGFATVSGYSFMISFLTALSCWLALAAFGLTLPLVAAFIVLVLISLGGVIPTPGAVGGFHAVCQLGIVAFFGVNSAQTVLPIVGMHAVLYIPPSIIGLLCIFDYGRHAKRAFIS